MALEQTRFCVYCKSADNLTVDHVIPLAHSRRLRIPKRVLDNKSNRVVACLRCNSEKKDLSPAVWFRKNPQYYKNFRHYARHVSDTVKKHSLV